MQELHTVNQVAGMLGVNPQTLYRWIREGSVVCFEMPGGRKRFDKDQVAAILKVKEKGKGEQDEEESIRAEAN